MRIVINRNDTYNYYIIKFFGSEYKKIKFKTIKIDFKNGGRNFKIK